ncbi:acyl carrier protein [Actinoplanes sp. NPDC051346]|uniref:acyl carrier protein n=1 Tax=Actinoplanes sp. NPDC051346 TaxID=3155048 RepID=UPI003447A781
MTIDTPAGKQTDVEHIIRTISEGLSSVLERDLGTLTADSRLFDEVGLDSTGVLDLMMFLEEALGIEFYTEELEMEHFVTVGALAAFISTTETGA